MKNWYWGLVVAIVLGMVFYFIETGNVWASIIILLAIIFYGLFANPMKELHAEKEKPLSPRKKTNAKKRKKKKR